MAEENRSRLGRGLAALIGDVGQETPTTERARAQRRLPIEFIRANPRNPRRTFAESELDELTASVQKRGIIQPILVRAVRGVNDAYEIIAGERRWRAAQRAGLHDVPVVVIEATDEQSLELAIIENVQRADLNPIEEALGYEALANEFKHSQDDLAQIVGKSRSHVANTLRLLKLPEKIKDHVRAGTLSAGHARMLIGQPNAVQMAEEIIARGLNVRQVEVLAREEGKKPAKGKKAHKPLGKDADTLALEKRVSDALGLSVTIDDRAGAGVLHVQYRDLDQLDEIVRRLERTQ
jgi:ParB family transcriptional regulator, chromosome partitioning protein